MTTLDISIIVPTRNRRGKIEKCLRAIADQTYPHDRFEVIVVACKVEDGTADHKISKRIRKG